jgi:hypothetical protein
MSQPVTLRETLGTLPDGGVAPLSMDQTTGFIRDRYKTRSEDDRRRESIRRIDMFRDRGRRHFEEVVDTIFKNAKVREWRKDFVRLAEFQNLTKRIVCEKSTVYMQPATRSVSKGDSRYQQLLRYVRFDRKMRQVNRYGNLINHCLVWPDVVDGRPFMRTVTTDHFCAVAHPNDPTRPVAFVIDQYPNGIQVSERSPHYLVMSELEFFKLDKEWRYVEGTYAEHGLGTMPALLWSREEPDDCILDATSGRDLTSAHLAVALLNTMMLKHQKSGTQLPYATGDVSAMSSGQPMDEEHLLQVPEGVSLSTLDLGADPESYIKAVRAVIKQIAANNGIPESVFDLSYQATSGFEIELKRSGLRELRLEQILDFRPFERDLAELWSIVLKRAGHELAFETAGWSIDFGEVDAPQDPMAKLDYWSKLEDMGLANRVEMYLEMNPEATQSEAIAAVAKNIEMRIKQMLMFQRAGAQESGAMQQQPHNQPADATADHEPKTDARGPQ